MLNGHIMILLAARAQGRPDLTLDYAAGALENDSSLNRMYDALARTAFSLYDLRRLKRCLLVQIPLPVKCE